MRKLKSAALISTIAAFAFGTQAQAATTIGQTFVPSVASTCAGLPDWEVVQHTRADGTSYAVPSAGILTSWSFEAGAAESIVTLRVFRPTEGHLYTVIADDGLKTISASSGVNTFPVRIPVQAGDMVGMRSTGGGPCADQTSNVEDTFDYKEGTALPVGSTSLYTHASGWIWDISAQLEADADNDGFGDETQDQCPTSATTQGQCPDTDPPETTITKDVRRSETGKVKFRFTSDEVGATFECRLKGQDLKRRIRQFNDCGSPRKYRNLDEGRFRFKVRAIDAAGNVDLTPAKDRFRVVD